LRLGPTTAAAASAAASGAAGAAAGRSTAARLRALLLLLIREAILLQCGTHELACQRRYQVLDKLWRILPIVGFSCVGWSVGDDVSLYRVNSDGAWSHIHKELKPRATRSPYTHWHWGDSWL